MGTRSSRFRITGDVTKVERVTVDVTLLQLMDIVADVRARILGFKGNEFVRDGSLYECIETYHGSDITNFIRAATESEIECWNSFEYVLGTVRKRMIEEESNDTI
jgi:hypothetical protein